MYIIIFNLKQNTLELLFLLLLTNKFLNLFKQKNELLKYTILKNVKTKTQI